MDFNLIEDYVVSINEFIWGMPIVCFIVLSGIIFSFVFSFVQIKNFFTGWKYLFTKEKEDNNTSKNSISPLQAFINALSSSLGNGGLGGMAVVLVDGGPGTAFWVFMLGFISMILRFTEVYAGISMFSKNSKFQGPLSYISKLPFGNFWVYLYSFVMLIYIFFGGIAMQTNTMGMSLNKTTGWPTLIIGLIFFMLVLYIVLGGSKRIMKLSEYIVPIKVIVFFIGIIALLIYHFEKIGETFKIIIDNAFTIESASKGVLAYTMQKAIVVGFAKALNATEAGLGTASIFFGATEAKSPIKTSIMSMISAFISTNLVCAALIFVIVLSGISVDGLTSANLVISAFETVFGKFAGPCITFLSFSFGIGVMVSYTFLGYRTWEFIFGKSFIWLYTILLPLTAFIGTILSVGLVWKSLDLLVGILIFINIIALMWVIPTVRRKFIAERKIIQ